MLTMNPMEARRRAGMVFQRPNPFPTMSITDNVLAGYKLNGIKLSKDEREGIVGSLRSVALWDEVKDQLKRRYLPLWRSATAPLHSTCYALRPEVLLMDEPTSALDRATNRVEELIMELKEKYTIVIVTHNI